MLNDSQCRFQIAKCQIFGYIVADELNKDYQFDDVRHVKKVVNMHENRYITDLVLQLTGHKRWWIEACCEAIPCDCKNLHVVIILETGSSDSLSHLSSNGRFKTIGRAAENEFN